MPHRYPEPPFPDQPQAAPGLTAAMHPAPDHGETSYVGHGRLAGRKAIITGGDSGIGRSVAIAFAREGADVAIAYLDEHEDARETVSWIERAGRRHHAFAGDLADPDACERMVDEAAEALGGLDIIVNNAAHQASFTDLDDISADEWQRTFAVNIHALFYICKAAYRRIPAGGAIINTASINSDKPNPQLLAYATTKGAVQNFTAGLAQMLADRQIRVNCVAPGPVWTPLIPATLPTDMVRDFGSQTPFGRPAQPAELASAYVLLASDEASYISGATIAVTGGAPML